MIYKNFTLHLSYLVSLAQSEWRKYIQLNMLPTAKVRDSKVFQHKLYYANISWCKKFRVKERDIQTVYLMLP